MDVPVAIVFSGVDPSPAVEQRIREQVHRLEGVFDRIVACRVAVSAPHGHKREDPPYNVRIEVRVPGHVVVTSRRPGDVNAHEDVMVAIGDAFDAAERDLKAWDEQREPGPVAH